MDNVRDLKTEGGFGIIFGGLLAVFALVSWFTWHNPWVLAGFAVVAAGLLAIGIRLVIKSRRMYSRLRGWRLLPR